MPDHVRALGVIGIVRALLGVALGCWLLLEASSLAAESYDPRVAEGTVRFDRTAFQVLGGLALVVAPFRAIQGVLALARRPLARPLGLGLATLDVLNLCLFPLSTALGLYGLVVYLNAETVVFLGLGPRPAGLSEAG